MSRKPFVDQVGYKVGGKVAAAVKASGSFVLVDKATGSEIARAEGRVGEQVDASSGDNVAWLDLPSVDMAGEYAIISLEGGDVADVTIAVDPYARVSDMVLKAFYYQRCGCALHEEHAGPWRHGVCHTTPGVLVGDTSVSLDVNGGWHDAGDYGKYIGPGAVAVAMLLLAYEANPAAFNDGLGIPESGNGVPDILDEARWELEWMLKMQRSDGAAYHKATSWGFCGMIMPEDDGMEIAICPVSAAATGDLAGVNAMAYRIYKDIDGEFAQRLLASAESAWAWLEANPDAPGFRNPQGVTTGEYGDGDVRDERLWAAVALYRATGDSSYADKAMGMLQMWPDVDMTTLGWGSVGGFAAVEVLFMDGAREDLRERFEKAFISGADRLVTVAGTDGYRVPMQPKDYVWGSTMVLLNYGAHLIMAYRLTGNKAYEDVALDCLHWLLGRNPMGVCYITGMGDVPIMQPHHRPSVADGVHEPVPGLVSGGPDKGRSDPKAKEAIPVGTPPAKCFIDDWESYATNEITIYWNAPAVFVAGWFSRR